MARLLARHSNARSDRTGTLRGRRRPAGLLGAGGHAVSKQSTHCTAAESESFTDRGAESTTPPRQAGQGAWPGRHGGIKRGYHYSITGRGREACEEVEAAASCAAAPDADGTRTAPPAGRRCMPPSLSLISTTTAYSHANGINTMIIHHQLPPNTSV